MNDLFKERVLIILALLLCIVSGVLGAWDAPQFSAINVVYTDALAVSSSAADTEHGCRRKSGLTASRTPRRKTRFPVRPGKTKPVKSISTPRHRKCWRPFRYRQDICRPHY